MILNILQVIDRVLGARCHTTIDFLAKGRAPDVQYIVVFAVETMRLSIWICHGAYRQPRLVVAGCCVMLVTSFVPDLTVGRRRVDVAYVGAFLLDRQVILL